MTSPTLSSSGDDRHAKTNADEPQLVYFLIIPEMDEEKILGDVLAGVIRTSPAE